MKTLTAAQFRRDMQRALAAVRRGERFLLTYRGQPVAQLEPVGPKAFVPSSDDALLRIDDFAIDGPGGALDNAEIDRAIYGG